MNILRTLERICFTNFICELKFLNFLNGKGLRVATIYLMYILYIQSFYFRIFKRLNNSHH